MHLKGRKILLGVSGGIAAYKTCELVRLFRKGGAEIRVIMTPSAVNFVSPVTLSTLSGNEVQINMFPDVEGNKMETVETKTWHVYTGLWADVYLIAPATANTIAKIAHGLSDNFLSSTVLASRCPIIVVPSMDEDMYLNKITQDNISKLRGYGYEIIEPDSGELASGLEGIGRMPEPQTIYDFTVNFLQGKKKDLTGKKILVTAGPTYEPIDDVRFIGNYSSGKMGFQIARAASERGAEVTLISGPSTLEIPSHIKRVNVQTAEEMLRAVGLEADGKDCIVMAAAVADFRPVSRQKGKIKKDKSGNLLIQTERTADILESLGKNKDRTFLIGFALETENEIENAKEKLKRKNLDLIVVNNPLTEGAGFGTDTNVAVIIDRDFNENRLQKMTKFQLANVILDRIPK